MSLNMEFLAGTLWARAQLSCDRCPHVHVEYVKAFWRELPHGWSRVPREGAGFWELCPKCTEVERGEQRAAVAAES